MTSKGPITADRIYEIRESDAELKSVVIASETSQK
jgi:hypothetical protein